MRRRSLPRRSGSAFSAYSAPSSTSRVPSLQALAKGISPEPQRPLRSPPLTSHGILDPPRTSRSEDTPHPSPSTTKPPDEDQWSKLADALDKHDTDEIQGCNDDIDTLLVFAGLFSSILTAFNVESYQNLQQDSGSLSTQILLQISQQLNSFTLNAGFLNTTQSPFNLSLHPFTPDPSAVRINILWFTSLLFSLIVASLSILVKQWLREYQSGRCTSPEERIRVRQFRYEGLREWRVFEIVAILPLLLQLALVLFFVGLSDFLRNLHPVVGWFITILIVVWLLLYAASTIAPALFSRCPYTTPFLKPGVRAIRRIVWELCGGSLKRRSKSKLRKYYSFPGDEMGVRRDKTRDILALVQADDAFRDDVIADDILKLCLRRHEGPDVLYFIRRMLSHRLDRPVETLAPSGKNWKNSLLDFARLSTRALATSVDALLDALEPAFHDKSVTSCSDGWTKEALAYVFSALQHCALRKRDIGPAAQRARALRIALLDRSHDLVRECLILCSRSPHPLDVTSDSANDNGDHDSIGNISERAAWNIIVVAPDLLKLENIDLRELCRIILDIAVRNQQHLGYQDPATHGHLRTTLHSLLCNFADAILHRPHTGTAEHIKRISLVCIKHCRTLKEKIGDFSCDELMHVLHLGTGQEPDPEEKAEPLKPSEFPISLVGTVENEVVVLEPPVQFESSQAASITGWIAQLPDTASSPYDNPPIPALSAIWETESPQVIDSGDDTSISPILANNTLLTLPTHSEVFDSDIAIFIEPPSGPPSSSGTPEEPHYALLSPMGMPAPLPPAHDPIPESPPLSIPFRPGAPFPYIDIQDLPPGFVPYSVAGLPVQGHGTEEEEEEDSPRTFESDRLPMLTTPPRHIIPLRDLMTQGYSPRTRFRDTMSQFMAGIGNATVLDVDVVRGRGPSLVLEDFDIFAEE